MRTITKFIFQIKKPEARSNFLKVPKLVDVKTGRAGSHSHVTGQGGTRSRASLPVVCGFLTLRREEFTI